MFWNGNEWHYILENFTGANFWYSRSHCRVKMLSSSSLKPVKMKVDLNNSLEFSTLQKKFFTRRVSLHCLKTTFLHSPCRFSTLELSLLLVWCHNYWTNILCDTMVIAYKFCKICVAVSWFDSTLCNLNFYLIFILISFFFR